MKKCLFAIGLFFFIFDAFSQEDLKIESFRLSNGLKVLLCEYPEQPKIYGAVLVNAGSKNDPSDATGMAHYFEHIMFKGTDKIGTLDWNSEKIYLDSINFMYDSLHNTNEAILRENIHKKINELTVKASKYAIPNETDVILTEMGGQGLNAGTSYDYTIYFNNFPSNQLENWLEVYAERFRYPVFRLFQSELETVYEEKNMYEDNPMNYFLKSVFREAFGEHPYGRPVIGLTEHLKNPQPNAMRKFFETYYVANNMTLILVGDVNVETAKPLINKYFSSLPQKELPVEPSYEIPRRNGHTIKQVKESPIKLGMMMYEGIPVNHTDEVALNVCSEIFSNGSTGLLDKAVMDNKILGAQIINLSLKDAGVLEIFYLPKIIGQKHEEAESIILSALDSLKQGKFSNELFEAIKINSIMSVQKEMESLSGVFNVVEYMAMKGISYQEYLEDYRKLQDLSREDVVRVANKYFTDNYLSYRSGIGFPPKDKIEKPNWKAIEAENTEAHSEFGQRIKNRNAPECTPQHIEIGENVEINDINSSFKLYSAKNPYNDIFKMNIRYRYGELSDHYLYYGICYLQLQGTETMTFEEFELALQKLGASVEFSCDDNYVSVTISGLEEDLDNILSLVKQKLFTPSNDESKLKILIESEKANKKALRNDIDTWDEAAYEYVMYGDESKYLKKANLKQIKAFKGEELLSRVSESLNYDGFVTYTGKLSSKEVIDALDRNELLKQNAKKGLLKVRIPKTYTENEIFTLHNSNFRQSHINFRVAGDTLSKDEKTKANVFNKYFGTDMYSIIFQEIREFRSLAYTAYGFYNSDVLNRYPGSLYCYLGTQSDKTSDALEIMCKLINNMPSKPEKFNTSKEALIRSNSINYIPFRNQPYTMYHWLLQGYGQDPREEQLNIIRHTDFKDINNFYQEHIKGNAMVIVLTGNMKKTDSKTIAKYGKLTKLKLKSIINQ